MYLLKFDVSNDDTQTTEISWAVVVTQLVEQTLWASEYLGSNPSHLSTGNRWRGNRRENVFLASVWQEKNRQMSIKVKKWFH